MPVVDMGRLGQMYLASPANSFINAQNAAQDRQWQQYQRQNAMAKGRMEFEAGAMQLLAKVPKEQRAQVYRQYYDHGRSLGADVTGINPDYSPEFDAMVDANTSLDPTEKMRNWAYAQNLPPEQRAQFLGGGKPNIIKMSLPNNRVQDVQVNPDGSQTPIGEPYDRMKPASVSVNMPPADSAYDKERGKLLAQGTEKIMAGASSSMQSDANLNALESAMADPNVYSGAGGSAVLKLKKAASAAGFNVDGIPESELAQSVSNQMALDLRNPAGGAGMPGALSDSDRNFLAQSVAGLGNSKEGNRQIIAVRRALNQRSRDVQKLMFKYMQKNGGRMDDGFYVELSDWAEKNPLFKGGVSVPAASDSGAVNWGDLKPVSKGAK